MRSKVENFKLLGDLAKMAGGAMGSLDGVRDQVKKLVKERFDALMDDMDVVSRREFDRVEAMAVKARARQEELEARLATLEKKLKSKAPAAPKAKTKPKGKKKK